ncbi:MAG: AMP-binding protein [Deltaproteobacteria bacterium]|nr:AMP-binding protein [Deltaproteobacteria bacterium]
MSRWLPVGDVLRVNATLYPDKEGAADLYRSLTFREWNERCNRLANALLKMGLVKGDRIAFIGHNSLTWMEFYGATAKNGLIGVPIMFRLAPLEYQYILENSGAKAFLVAQEFIEGVESIRGKLPAVEHWIYLGDGQPPEGYVGYEELMASGSPEECPIKVNHQDVWTIMYTSGTTGKPKGVVRTHESYVGFYLTNIVAMEYNKHDRGLLVMPMCHINSIFYAFSFTYCCATAVVYNMTSFDPEHLLKTLAEAKITFTSLVPTHYIMILSLPGEIKNAYDMSSIKKLLCSSAPARKDTKMGILEFFKNSQLYEAYGSTEAGLVTLLYPEEQFDKLGSIGREIPGTELLKLLDEKGDKVAPGEVGELYSNGAALFTEYWKMPKETEAAFKGEWFSAGDMARQDADGYYYLVDRKKNMIITGGENLYPSEVESLVGSHPAVKDVAVIGVPDEKWGERVTAVVVLHQDHKPGPELAEGIREFCQGKIAGFKRPKEIRFIADEEMPRTATGKILHRALRERFGDWTK